MKHPFKTEITDTSKTETPSDIAAMFESIYQNEWLAATEELREFKIDEKTYSSFLLNIIFVSIKLLYMYKKYRSWVYAFFSTVSTVQLTGRFSVKTPLRVHH